MEDLSQAGNQFGRGLSVLVIDTDADLRTNARRALERNGFRVLDAERVEDALPLVEARGPNVLLVEVSGYLGTGLRTIRELRRATPAVVIAMASGWEAPDATEIVEAGADDVLEKPIRQRELFRRLRVHRDSLGTGGDVEGRVVSVGGVSLDLGQRLLTRDGRGVRLAPIQWRILAEIVRAGGEGVSATQLWAAVWNAGGPIDLSRQEARVLESHIAQIRGRVEPAPLRAVLLHGDADTGYRWIVPTDADVEYPPTVPWANAHKMGEPKGVIRFRATVICRLDSNGRIVEWRGPTPSRRIGQFFGVLYSSAAQDTGAPGADLAAAAANGVWQIRGIRDGRDKRDSWDADDYLVRIGDDASAGFLVSQGPPRHGLAELPGGAMPSRGPVDFAGAVRDALERLIRYEFFGWRIVGTVPEADLPTRLGVGEVELLLQNLMQNAVEALERAGRPRTVARVYVTVSRLVLDDEAAAPRQVSSGPYIEVMVRDGGTGIAPEVRDTLFEPFVSTKLSESGGIGLGLAVVSGLALNRGGYITTCDEPGTGVAFRVGFPEAMRSEPAAAPTVLGTTRTSGYPDLQGEYAMVIEADAPRRQYVADTLVAAGYRVAVEAPGAAELLLEANAPFSTLLVIGVEVSDASMASLLSALPKRFPHLALVLSCREPERLRAAPPELPAKIPILRPPFTAAGLIAAVCEAVQRPRPAPPPR
jgi:two-component system KDP operon response regulator KdpE